MTRIYLVRHAEAEGNLYRIAQGQYNSILTDRGWRQVEALRRRFADIRIDAVYASDLYRTQITARAIWLPKALPLHLEPSFREILPGHFVLCNDEEEAKYREEIKSLDSGEIIIKNGQEVKAGE